MRPYHLLISCEHAGNHVPQAYDYLFRNNDEVLKTHKGYDIGALSMARHLSDNLRAKLFVNEISRLLIDCNRSLDNESLFSDVAKPLKKAVKEYIIEHYYTPHRQKIERYIADKLRTKPVLHLAVHTFTPIQNGIERLVDVGLLYDERSKHEKRFCEQWKSRISNKLPDKIVVLNAPYNGADDGFTTYLRTKFGTENYLGIEIEVNQKYDNQKDMETILNAFVETIDDALESMDGHYLLHLP